MCTESESINAQTLRKLEAIQLFDMKFIYGTVETLSTVYGALYAYQRTYFSWDK